MIFFYLKLKLISSFRTIFINYKKSILLSSSSSNINKINFKNFLSTKKLSYSSAPFKVAFINLFFYFDVILLEKST